MIANTRFITRSLLFSNTRSNINNDIIRNLSTTKQRSEVHNPHSSALERVAIIGSGNWGSVAARIVAQNVARNPQTFAPEVSMWVYEEKIQASKQEIQAVFDQIDRDHLGKIDLHKLQLAARDVGLDLNHNELQSMIDMLDKKHKKEIDFNAFYHWWTHASGHHHKAFKNLTELINRENENIKYLPGIKLGRNVSAKPQLIDAVRNATTLIFVTPHQFIKKICQDIRQAGVIDLNKAKAISLIKGMEVTENGFELISELIHRELHVDCSVLMGANLANEVALEHFSEATIGYKNENHAKIFHQLFNTPYFDVNTINDVEGVEMCGTLKNIVALSAGFVDGLKLGNNTKAAVIRVGLVEMMRLSHAMFPTVQPQTFLESCGVADLITTCFGGRNRKCAEAYVLAHGKKTFDDLEKELLNGQKLQGVLTSHEVQAVLRKKNWEKQYPLFTTINRIVQGKIAPAQIVNYKTLP